MNRDDMVRAFQAAFDEWERRHGACAMTGSFADRGSYFAALLDDLSGGHPWAEIGKVPS